jgi:hypothetical protein
MKKLSFVFLVIVLVSYLLAGCLPVTPAEGEGEGEGEVEICPTLEVTSQVVVEGKTYIKGGEQTITVTFAKPTELVSVYVGGSLKVAVPVLNNNPEGVPDNAVEVVMYPDEEKKIYTGTFNFLEIPNQKARQNNSIYNPPCSEDYIYVLTCDTCAPCKYPYIVDDENPLAEIKITIDDCDCAGCELSFTSTSTEPECAESELCCGDDCSGLASWAINLYGRNPFDSCCDPSLCEEPIATGSGIDCPIDFTTGCLEAGTYYAVISLVDNVDLEETYYAKIELTGGITTVETLCLPETVQINLNWPTPVADSYFATTITPNETGYDYLNGVFEAWCADDFTYISLGQNYGNTYIYSSIDKVNPPDCVIERPWGSINWILNNWQTIAPTATWQDVQVTIWTFIHGGDVPCLCVITAGGLPHSEANVQALFTSAEAHSDYVPSSDELMAVILLVNNLCPDGDEIVGNNDPNAKQMTFFGIPRNELYCESETIDLPCSITVSEGFEVPAPDCITWTETDNTIGTCEAEY